MNDQTKIKLNVKVKQEAKAKFENSDPNSFSFAVETPDVLKLRIRDKIFVIVSSPITDSFTVSRRTRLMKSLPQYSDLRIYGVESVKIQSLTEKEKNDTNFMVINGSIELPIDKYSGPQKSLDNLCLLDEEIAYSIAAAANEVNLDAAKNQLEEIEKAINLYKQVNDIYDDMGKSGDYGAKTSKTSSEKEPFLRKSEVVFDEDENAYEVDADTLENDEDITVKAKVRKRPNF